MPYVDRNGVRIHFEEQGEGPPLLLIMGLGASWKVWEPHSERFRRHFRCILPDNRGAGESDNPDMDYTTEMMAEDMVAVLDSLGIADAHVAGISMGSAVAQQMAIRHPGRVRSLVLISSWAACDAYTKALFETFRVLRAKLDPPDFSRYLQLVIYSPDHYGRLEETLRQGAEAAWDGYMPFRAFAAQCHACATHDASDRLGEIGVPTLVTVGDKDIFTPLAFSRYLHERIRGARLVVFENAGHVHHFEEVERFNDLVVEFLTQLERR